MSSTQFSNLSLQLTKSIPKEIKKNNGIYFTPLSIVEELSDKAVSELETDSVTAGLRILEPSCGTCEFVKFLDNQLSNVSFDCVEFNSTIYEDIKDITFKNKSRIILSDFLAFKPNASEFYDLIIGNPPYIVCKKEQVPNEYKEYVVGRPNIFGLFILHSLSMLKPGGVLAFVIPKSFFNSAYYANIRYYIKQTCQIVDITEYSGSKADKNLFLDTQQETFGLVLKKRGEEETIPEDCPFSFLKGGSFIFSANAEKLKTFFEYSTTLEKLGLSVKTGTVVWNEHKELLTPDETNTTLLYNTNVTNDNKIKLTKFKNDEKQQYINMEGSTDPIIVVNRGNGNAKYTFKYALIEKFAPYVVENHLNMIYPTTSMDKKKLTKVFKEVIQSFENPKTKEFIALFFGNNGLSKTELETILPIYIN